MRRFVLLSVFVLSIVGGQALTEKDVSNCIRNCGTTLMDVDNYCGLVNDKRRTLDEEHLKCLARCRIPYKLAYPGTCAEDKLRILDPSYNEACHHCMEALDYDQLCSNIHTPYFIVTNRNNVECESICNTNDDAYRFLQKICADRSLAL